MASLCSLRTVVAARPTGSARISLQARLRPVRAVPEQNNNEVSVTTDANGATYFYRGKSYNEQEWQAAKQNGELTAPVEHTPVASFESGGEIRSFGDLMAFSGPAPELINGRLAMLAFVAALGAELSSGEGVMRQLAEEPTGVLLAGITFSIATLIPLLSTTERKPVGPFTAEAETLNGRAAMIGFAALLLVEAVRGGAALF